MPGSIEIRKISIVNLDTDSIVNAANEALAAGGGVCGAIFAAAGYEQLQDACDVIGHCDTGSAVMTPGFGLKAGYVIHAVGPIYMDGKHGEPQQLKSAYKKALELAAAHHCRSIGFPLISSGIYGYPLKSAWCEALDACKEFLDGYKGGFIRIVFAVLSDEVLKEGRKCLLQSSASAYKVAQKEDWKIFTSRRNPTACEATGTFHRLTLTACTLAPWNSLSCIKSAGSLATMLRQQRSWPPKTPPGSRRLAEK